MNSLRARFLATRFFDHRISAQRQNHAETGTLAPETGDLNVPAVGFGNVMGDGKSKTGAMTRSLGGEEGLEDSC